MRTPLSRTRRTTGPRPGSARPTRRWRTTSAVAGSTHCAQSTRTRPCSRSSRLRGSSATAEPASPPSASGRPSSSSPAHASSSSMPTKGSRARSRTATSWSCGRTSCWRAWRSRPGSSRPSARSSICARSTRRREPGCTAAIAEFREAGLLGSMPVEIVTGAGSYVCGEETAMLESLEGRRGMPRLRPPFPAESGYLGLPTLINNVETLAHIPAILRHGGAWFAGHGDERRHGPPSLVRLRGGRPPGLLRGTERHRAADVARRVRRRRHGGDRRDRARRRGLGPPTAGCARRAADARGNGGVGLRRRLGGRPGLPEAVSDRPPDAGDDAVLRGGVVPEVHALPHRHARARVRPPRAGGRTDRARRRAAGGVAAHDGAGLDLRPRPGGAGAAAAAMRHWPEAFAALR